MTIDRSATSRWPTWWPTPVTSHRPAADRSWPATSLEGLTALPRRPLPCSRTAKLAVTRGGRQRRRYTNVWAPF